MKRFWTSTSVVKEGDAFTIQLDGKALKMPSGKQLSLPFMPLATAIAAEWRLAGGEDKIFTPDDLPLTRLATTAQDRVEPNRGEIINQLAAYGMNDLLCYRASDQLLAAREYESWQPWLDWAQARYGITLLLSNSIIPIDQPADTRTALCAILGGMSAWQLAGLGVLVPALGSLILGLAIEAGALSPQAAADAAHLSETWQESRWGADEEAARRRELIAADIAVSARFMILCQP